MENEVGRYENKGPGEEEAQRPGGRCSFGCVFNKIKQEVMMRFTRRREKVEKVHVCSTITGSLKATQNVKDPLRAYIPRKGQKKMCGLLTTSLLFNLSLAFKTSTNTSFRKTSSLAAPIRWKSLPSLD